MKKLLLIAWLSYAAYAFGQDGNIVPIVTDRPTQSAATAVVPKGRTIIETGFVHESAGDIHTTTFANVLARVGVLNGFELRLTQNVLRVKDNFADSEVSGLSPLTIGTKVHLMEEKGIRPQMSVIGQVTLQSGEEDFQPNQPIPELRLNFSHTLSDQFSIGYNVGAAFSDSVDPVFITLALVYAPTPKLSFFAEPYGVFNIDSGELRFNSGVMYLLKDNLQFDVSAGIGLDDIFPDSFVGFGFAFGF